jgi:RHS repeat-associated protein
MYFTLPDHLGSAAVTIDAASSEMVERTMYLAFGATEMDYRPDRWNNHREAYKFTGKEEDIEAGLTYFGARYYQPYLGRWASADPMTIHGLGSDLNPYAYVGGRVMTHVDPFGLTDAPEGALVNPDGSWIVATPGGPNDYEAGGGPSDTPARGPLDETGRPATLRDIASFERVDNIALGQRQTAIDIAKSAATGALQEVALNIVDPTHVNRNFIEDALTAINSTESSRNRAVAVASIVLAFIPALGEERLFAAELAHTGPESRVYQLVDELGEPWRAGETVDARSRLNAHAREFGRSFRGMQIVSNPLPLPQARALEASLGERIGEATLSRESSSMYKLGGNWSPELEGISGAEFYKPPTYTILNPAYYPWTAGLPW